MKDFRRNGQLRGLKLHSRLVYSSFLVFTLGGVALTMWLAHDMVGLSMGGFDEYYAGQAAPLEAGIDLGGSAEGGPALDLPEEMLVAPAAGPMALRKLLEVTHFHMFSMPVYLLILAHLFAMSTASARSKSTFIGMATIGTLLHIAAPWWAAYQLPGSVWAYSVSGTMLMLSYVVMCVVPLWDMWRPAVAPAPRRSKGPVEFSSSVSSPAE